MKKAISRLLMLFIVMALAVNLAGCAALKKKFTRKKKPKPPETVFSEVRKYDVKPNLELYEKHYIFWVNWHKKFVVELGKSHKSDIRSLEEMVSNLQDMFFLLADEKGDQLKPHIDEIIKARAIIEKRHMTKLNETRIRRIAEKEYRIIKREFSPRKVAGYIREDWR